MRTSRCGVRRPQLPPRSAPRAALGAPIGAGAAAAIKVVACPASQPRARASRLPRVDDPFCATAGDEGVRVLERHSAGTRATNAFIIGDDEHRAGVMSVLPTRWMAFNLGPIGSVFDFLGDAQILRVRSAGALALFKIERAAAYASRGAAQKIWNAASISSDLPYVVSMR
jgi:hypothetical protein